MRVKAIESFAGTISMIKGEERNVKKEVAEDLIKASFVKEATKKVDK